jgi:hypothetical protein
LGQAKQCIINAFDPNVTVPAGALTEHLLRHADHLDDPVGEPPAPFPASAPASAFLAKPPHRRSHPPPSGRTPLDKRANYSFAEKCGCCGDPDHRGSNRKATDAQIIKWQRYKIKTLHEHFNRVKAPTAHRSVVSDDTPVTVDIVAKVDDSDPLSDYLVRAPAGGAAAAAPEGGALAGPSAPTSTSTRWALVTP